MNWLKAAYNVRDRANRARFWISVGLATTVLAVLLIAFWAYALSLPGAYENGGPTPFPSDPLGIAMTIIWFALVGIVLLTMLAVTIRRLHDRDMAWWWILVFLIGPNFLYGLGEHLSSTEIEGPGALSVLLRIVSMAAFILGVIVLGFLPGTKGDNRYGPDPLAGTV
jgi:uncharacterized membrane protein YhaH (DUF805 family)